MAFILIKKPSLLSIELARLVHEAPADCFSSLDGWMTVVIVNGNIVLYATVTTAFPFFLNSYMVMCWRRRSYCLFLFVNRFVADQEAWHELSELYINEHE